MPQVGHSLGFAVRASADPSLLPRHSCRQPISKTYIFALGAFEPTDDELAEATGVVEEDKDDPMDDVDDEGDLKDFIVRDHESEDEDGSKPHKKVKQPNRRIIQDSDDESEAEEAAAPTSKKSKGKGKGKQESKDLPEWMRSQEPSTKMLWALEEIKRLDSEYVNVRWPFTRRR